MFLYVLEALGHRRLKLIKNTYIFLNQLVEIQLPSVEDGEGFLPYIRFKNVSVVDQIVLNYLSFTGSNNFQHTCKKIK